MQLEILEFYPKERNGGFVSGEIKIRLPDLAINVLGIYISKRTNGTWLILMPCKYAIDSEGRKVRYPVVSFEEAFHKELMGQLYDQAPSFVEKRLADTENPVIFPPQKPNQSTIQQPSHQTRPSSALAQPTKAKPADTTFKASNAPAKSKVFVDLPRKVPTMKGKGRCIVKTI